MKCLVTTCVSIINNYFSDLLSFMVEYKLENAGLKPTPVIKLGPADVAFSNLKETRQAVFYSALFAGLDFIVQNNLNQGVDKLFEIENNKRFKNNYIQTKVISRANN